MKITSIRQLKEALRDGPYAWPGGYPKYFIAGDGEPMAFKTVRDEWRCVCRAMLDGNDRDQWFIIGVEINWEDTDLRCAHTNEKIQSAYGDDK